MNGILSAATGVDWGTLLAPAGAEVGLTVAEVVPVGVVGMIALVGIGIAVRVLGKFGIKR